MTKSIIKAKEIIENEGYYIDNKMSAFSVFRTRELGLDKIKSFVIIRDDTKFDMKNGVMYIKFKASVNRISSDEFTTDENRQIANYLLHICDIVDELNSLNIEIHTDLREIEGIF